MEYNIHFIFVEGLLLFFILLLILLEVNIRLDSKGVAIVYNNLINSVFFSISFVMIGIIGYGMLKVGSIIDLRC